MSTDNQSTSSNISRTDNSTSNSALQGDNQLRANAFIERVTVKPPLFWEKSPALWFSVVEAQFETSNITRDATKYFQVLQSLDQNTLTKVEDVVLAPPELDKYGTLKKAIIDRLTDSENQKFQKLIRELELGDKKPSQLLREMKSLSGTQFSEEIIKKLWIQRLPHQAQVILAVSSEPIDRLSLLADKILETYANQPNVFALDSGSTSKNDPFSAFTSELRAEISELKNEFHDFKRSRSTSRFDSSNRSRSKSNSKKEHSLCWYHYRFRGKASKCIKPCAFVNNSKDQKN